MDHPNFMFTFLIFKPTRLFDLLPFALYYIVTKSILLSAFFLLIGTLSVQAQHPALEYLKNYVLQPPMKVFLPDEDYDGLTQNWSALQLDDGRLFITNSRGLFLYDGNAVHTIPAVQGILRDLVQTDDGEIYASGSSYFARIYSDEQGNWQAENLWDILPEFPGGQVGWQILEHDEALYIRFRTGFMRVQNQEAIYTPFPENSLSGKLFSHNNRLFTVINRQNLYEIKGADLEFISQIGETPESNAVILPWPHQTDRNGNDLLLINLGAHFVTFDTADETFEKLSLPQPLHDFITSARPYSSTMLTNGYLALGSISGGMMIVDENFNQVLQLNTQKGLPSNTILNLYEDREGGLWLLTGNGFVRIDFFYPYWKSVRDREFFGSVYQTILTDTSLIITTAETAYIVKENEILEPDDLPRKPSAGMKSIWFTMPDGSSKLITQGLVNELFFVDNNRFVPVHNRTGSELQQILGFQITGDDPGHLILSLAGELNFIEIRQDEQGEYYYDYVRPLVDEELYFYESFFDSAGSLWVLTDRRGLIRIYNDSEGGSLFNDYENNRIQFFDSTDSGLPELDSFIHIGEEPVLFLEGVNRFYHLSQDLPAGIPYTEAQFEEANLSIPPLYFINEIPYRDGMIYQTVSDDNTIRMATVSAAGEFTFKTTMNAYGTPYLANSGTSLGDDIVFASNQGVIGYREELAPYYNLNSVFIPTLTSLHISNDSLHFGGGLLSSANEQPVFAHNRNQMRFEYAQGTLAFPGAQAEYQTRLIPFNDQWSEWNGQNIREFTSLRPGNYTFEVRSRNSLGNISETLQYSFVISTPWFMSAWAYLIYFSVLVLVVGYTSRKISDYRIRLTEQKMKAQQAEELVKLDQMRTRLFTNISHDLRTPITLMSAPVQNMLQKHDLPEEVVHNLKISLRSSERLRQLVEQVLDLTRLESDKLTLFVRPLDIAKTTRRIVALFQSLSEFNQLHLESNITDEPVIIYADPDKVDKALTNLISNAFKFTGQGGRVTIELSEAAGHIYISVRDTGIGISEHNLAFIFDPFHSSAKSKVDYREGLGIGLTLTREYMDLHKGDIRVQSKEGAGSTFLLRFRKGKEHFDEADIVSEELFAESGIANESRDKQVTTDDSASEKSHSVLLVEDNRDITEYVTGILANQGYHVETAINGQDGLRVLKTFTPDIIISDIMMPAMDGFAFLKELKKDAKLSNTPVVFLSAKSDLEGKLESFRMGVNDYVVKPFNPSELLVRIENLLALSEERNTAAISTEDDDTASPIYTDSTLNEIKTLVESKIDKSGLTLDELAPQVAMSRSSLYRFIKKETGLTAGGFVKEIRLQKAREMIESQNYKSVKEIALAVGFSHSGYFSAQYAKRFGIKPNELI